MNIRSNTIKELKREKDKLAKKIEEGTEKMLSSLLEKEVKNKIDTLVNSVDEDEEEVEETPEQSSQEEEVDVVTLDNEGDEEDFTDSEDPEVDFSEDEGFWDDLEDTKDEEGMYDLTKSDDDRVINVLKRLRPGDDNIYVTKGEDESHIDLRLGDDEYVIELVFDEEGEDSEDVNEEVLPHVGKDNKRMKRSTPYCPSEKMVNRDRCAETEFLNEMDIEDTLEDTLTNDYDEETIQHITEHTIDVISAPLTKKVVKETMKKVSGIYENSYRALKEEFDEYKKSYGELKQIAENLYKALNETSIVNESLGEFVKIVTNYPTTKAEKKNISLRLSEAKNSKELKRISEGIKRELMNVNENKKLAIDENICVKKSSLAEGKINSGDKALEPTLELMRKICN